MERGQGSYELFAENYIQIIANIVTLRCSEAVARSGCVYGDNCKYEMMFVLPNGVYGNSDVLDDYVCEHVADIMENIAVTGFSDLTKIDFTSHIDKAIEFAKQVEIEVVRLNEV